MTVLDTQRRLKTLGYDPGPLDGIFGRLTIRAIRAFQSDRGLVADGIVGPMTAAALFGEEAIAPHDKEGSPVAPWFKEALRLKGTREAAGAGDNSVILGWARRLGFAYAHDSVPWCGLFVAHCVGATLPEEPLPTNPLGARNWLRFGRPTEPVVGAVLVFWRGSPEGWTGHVGFHAGADEAAYHVLGGNQSDAVTVSRIARGRLLGARWPLTGPAPISRGAVLQADSPAISVDEA